MNVAALWVALGVLLVSLAVAMALSRRTKTWYRVFLANPEMSVIHVYRTGWDKIWRSDEAGIMVFHTEGGKEIRVGKHWILKLEEE